jgi:hypothetical protein
VPGAYLGSKTLGQALPLALAAEVNIAGAVGIGLPEISGKIAGLLNVQAALTISPPDLSGTIAAVAQVAVALQAAISGPTVTLQVGAIAALLVELNIQLGQLNAYLAFDMQLGTAGIHMYSFTGRADELGPALQGLLGLGPPGSFPDSETGAVLFVAVAPSARLALGAFVGLTL